MKKIYELLIKLSDGIFLLEKMAAAPISCGSGSSKFYQCLPEVYNRRRSVLL